MFQLSKPQEVSVSDKGMKIIALFLVCLYLVAAKVFKDDARALNKNYAIVLVSREGCGHCKNLKYFEDISENENVDFVKLDSRGSNFKKLVETLGLKDAPHLGSTPMFYLLKRKDGKLALDKNSIGTGNIQKEGLEKLLSVAK